MVTKTQPTDIFQTATGVDGIDFDQLNETWIIGTPDSYVHVLSQSGNGIFSDYANSVVINGGQIYGAGSSVLSGFGGDGVGVNLQDNATDTVGNGTVINNAGAQIFGLVAGVQMWDKVNNLVTNYGAIIGGYQDGVVFLNGASNALNNYGEIYGGSDGVDVETNPSVVTSIHNAADGVIMGGFLASSTRAPIAVIVNSGILHLTNHGLIIGDIDTYFGIGNDVIINPGRIKGTVGLGNGDVFNGTGGHSGAIFCSTNDVVDAGVGRVVIHTGDANNLLTAGPGHDKFVFFELAGQVDEIDKFDPSRDKIALTEGVFAGLGPVGTLSPVHFSIGSPGGRAITGALIVYNPSDGFLYYEHHPLLGQPSVVHFATLTTHTVVDNHIVTFHPLVDSSDFIIQA